MSKELDVFAGAVGVPAAPAAPAPQQGGAPKKKYYRKQFARNGAKQNNSPLRGANGEESVNPLLNAPLPTEQKAAEPEAPANPRRNPELPEFELKDIQTWPAQQIVDRMMPGARLLPQARAYLRGDPQISRVRRRRHSVRLP